MIAPPEVQIGDWVRLRGRGIRNVIDARHAEWLQTCGLTIIEIRGTRDGHAWHWTREGGAKP